MVASHRNFCMLMVLCLWTACGNAMQQQYFKGIPRSERKGLAILNFCNNTPAGFADEFKPWEYGISAMLMTDLESMGRFNLVSRERLKDVLAEHKLMASGLVDPKTAVKVGRLTAAHFILTGSFSVMDDRLRIEANVFSVQNGSQLCAAAVSGEVDAFFDVEKQLVLKLSDYLKAMPAPQERIVLTRNIETRSYKASLSNYAGEQALSEAQDLKSGGKTDQADAALMRAKQNFKQALEIDPAYRRARNNLKKLVMGVPLTL